MRSLQPLNKQGKSEKAIIKRIMANYDKLPVQPPFRGAELHTMEPYDLICLEKESRLLLKGQHKTRADKMPVDYQAAKKQFAIR
jgi:cytochrome c-type biogenesis protein CcmH/NrfF